MKLLQMKMVALMNQIVQLGEEVNREVEKNPQSQAVKDLKVFLSSTSKRILPIYSKLKEEIK